MRILVTGTAGFIGYHVAEALLAAGDTVVGIDGFTPYYDIALKEARHARLERQPRFEAHRFMLEDATRLLALMAERPFDAVVHLAAQAGVRYSLEAPRAYVDSNLVGSFNVLEAARAHKVGHLLVASTSSVYGANPEQPFRESDRVAHPLTLYAATKLAMEHMAHSYAHLFDIPTTAFRFFTVYGPWGRPDMAYFKFTRAILEGQPIELYNAGHMSRDFTYVDDLVHGIVGLLRLPPERPTIGAAAMGGQSPVAPFRVVNLGRGAPVDLLEFVNVLERVVGRSTAKTMLPMQPGDVPSTFASPAERERLLGPSQDTPLADGLARFVDWYRKHYSV